MKTKEEQEVTLEVEFGKNRVLLIQTDVGDLPWLQIFHKTAEGIPRAV